jgi:hypothetical protein
MQSDISKAWLNCESLPIGISDTILINRTARYQNESINYFFLKNHKCAFIGVDSEYESFTKQWKLNIPHLKVDNFYHLAQLLNACKFFIGNQSMAYNIAEGLKSKRILELCNFAPNCYVTGDNGQEFLHQHGLEYAVQQWS